MAINPDFEVEPLSNPLASLPIVREDGTLTEHGVGLLQEWRDFISGTARIIPCWATTTSNAILLTPAVSAPKIDAYRDFLIFAAKADASTTGAVTADVQMDVGRLGTVKVYKNAGAAQAGNGDIVSGSVYMFLYADHLDSGAGGLVLK